MRIPHILIVEDEAIIRSALRRLLERHKYRVSEAGSVREAQQRLTELDINLIITDLRLPGPPGTELIELYPGTPVLVITSYATLRSAVDSMKMGAVDYIAKPFDHEQLLRTIAHILARNSNRSREAAGAEASKVVTSPVDLNIIGRSQPIQELFAKIIKIAPTNSTVLIQGEYGTGKELVASALHKLSKRAQSAMVTLNFATIGQQQIEAELFGHEPGAFNGANNARAGLIEAANGGTLFLDEISELPLIAQARLLRVLQEGESRRLGSVQAQQVDVRLLAASQKDLKALTQSGDFREDLYYRLQIINLHLPPLRERGDDLIEIAQSLLAEQSQKLGQTLKFAPATDDRIRNYSCPGNVQELKNAIERAVILCDSGQIEPQLLGLDNLPKADANQTGATRGRRENLSLADYFQHFVLENQDHMTETELARALGISRKSLWERRQRLGISRRKSGNS